MNMFRFAPNPLFFFTSILFLCIIIPPFPGNAETFQPIIDVAGTSGDDFIVQVTPVEASIDKTTDQGGILNVSSTGIDTLSGDDTVDTDEEGTIFSNAISSAVVDYAEEKVEAQSLAIGICTDSGSDNVTVGTSITTSSNATAHISELSLTAEPMFIDQGSGATAESSGIAGGLGTDSITNNDHLTVAATADNTMVSVTLTPAELPADVYGYGIVPITAEAKAVGISGGLRVPYYDSETEEFLLEPATSGVQLLVNNGLMDVSSIADSRDLSVNMEIYGKERGFADLKADAISVAMIGSDGTDEFTNTGIMDVDAISSTTSILVDLQFKLLPIPNPPQGVLEFFGAPLGEGDTQAAATAVGFYGGNGNDTFINNGPDGVFVTQPAEDCATSTANICATATASSTDVRVVYSSNVSSSAAVTAMTASVGGALVTDPLAQENVQEGDVKVTKSSTAAEASSYGFWGGDGQDNITNMSPLSIESFANSKSIAVSLGIDPSASSKFPFSGLSIADGETIAEAQTIGIFGGGGSDVIDNQDGLGAFATADANSTSVTTDLKFDATSEEDADGGGFVLSPGFAKASTAGKATAVGIGGSGGTEIDNSGHIVSYADSESDSTSVTVEIAINHDKGDLSLAGAGSFTNAESSAEAYSYGIADLGELAPGSDGDSIDNEGIIDSTAHANAESRSASATLSYAYKGLSAGFTFADTGTKAYAEAIGITRVAGEGPITNKGDGSEVHAEAEAIAKSTTLGLTVNITPKGGSFGGAVGLADTEARAVSAGITAGRDNDTITSEENLTSMATAVATSGTYALTANFSQLGAGVSYLKAGTRTDATAVGIDGGAGIDAITADGIIDVDAIATTRATSVTVNFSHLGAAISDSSSTATSRATGLDGGSGYDTITNIGELQVDSVATMNEFNFTANMAGYAEGDLSFHAVASAMGIDAGNRDEDTMSGNTIVNVEGASVTVLANSEYSANNYVINGGGLAIAKAGSTTESDATGIAGGLGLDNIDNSGMVSATSKTKNKATNLGFTIAGVQKIEADISAEATVIGIDASDGDNVIHNYDTGDIGVYAKVDNLSGSVGAGLLDFTFTAADADATVTAAGIQSGAGADQIYTEGGIDVTANVFNDAGSGAIGLFAYSGAKALSSATMQGINSGGGNDLIENSGYLKIGEIVVSDPSECIVNGAHYDTIACARAASVAVDLISIVNTRLGAEAELAGIVGEEGDDTILNKKSGAVTVGDDEGWMVIGETDSITSALFSGFELAMADSIAILDSVGFDGGTGDDEITNLGLLNVYASALSDSYAEAYITSVNFIFSGYGISVAGSDSSVTATGIRGGQGDDNLINSGVMTIDGHAKGRSESIGDVGVLDDVYIGSNATITSTVVGMDTGPGLNHVTNGILAPESIEEPVPGNIASLDVTSLAEVYLKAWAGTGSSGEAYSQKNSADVSAEAWGIRGGTDADQLSNLESGNIYVTATAGKKNVNSVDVFAEDHVEVGPVLASNSDGVPSVSSPGIVFSARAIGMDGGRGSDIVESYGNVDVQAYSNGWGYAHNSSNERWTSADLSILSEATSIGLMSSDGVSKLIKDGSLSVATESSGISSSASDSVYGCTADAWLKSSADAMGIYADNGYADIDHFGTTEVFADATTYSYTRADSYYDPGHARSSAFGKAEAAGIEAGDGGAIITASGIIDVNATVMRPDYADWSAYGWGDDYCTTAGLAEATAVGIRAGAGSNEIENSSIIYVDAFSYEWGKGYSSTGDTSIDDIVKVSVVSMSTAVGLISSGEINSITNTSMGEIYTTAEAYGRTLALADTEPSIPTSGANAYAEANTESIATAIGIDTEQGYATIDNTGVIDVAAYAKPHAGSNAWANSGDAEARGTATGTASAVGIQAGNSGSSISNNKDGVISITAGVIPNELYHQTLLVWNSAEEITKASGFADVEAVGVKAGAGYNEIVNAGDLIVTATANNNVYPVGGGDLSYAEVSTDVSATGISAGVSEGNVTGNFIINSGYLDVSAEGVSYFSLYGDADVKDFDISATTSAIGIETGGGDDIIINDGSILTRESEKVWILPEEQTAGVAITTGGGNDQLFLMDGSVTKGSIDLGEGDDNLVFSGTPLVDGDLTGAAGIDTLVFDGPGSTDLAPTAFEKAQKKGPGTYSTASLSPMQMIAVNQGTLQVDSNYAMANDSIFQTIVNGDSSHGQLNVNGNVQLNGELNVVKGPGFFRNGTLYDIIVADEVDGIFSSELLPEELPLLSFQTTTLPDRVEVEVLAKSFTAVATTSLQQTIARHLDNIMPQATGDLELFLGDIQRLSEPDFDQVFAGLSPDSYNNSSRITLSGAEQYIRTMQQRMHSLRSSLKIAAAETPPKNGVWLQGLRNWGDQEGEDGFTGYDYSIYGGMIGLDRLLKDHALLGFSTGVSGAEIDFDNNLGKGDIDAFIMSLYGSWFTERYYLDASLSFGNQDYSNSRNIIIGGIERTYSSNHDGTIFSSYLEGGYNFSFNSHTLGLFTALNYLYLDEDGFTESGDGVLDLKVDDRQTEALFSQLGAVAASRLTFENFDLMPELRVAWKHDFEIDDQVITAAYTGAPDVKFSIAGQNVDRDSLLLEAGATLFYKNELSIPIKYAAEFRNDYSNHALFGLIRYEY